MCLGKRKGINRMLGKAITNSTMRFQDGQLILDGIIRYDSVFLNERLFRDGLPSEIGQPTSISSLYAGRGSVRLQSVSRRGDRLEYCQSTKEVLIC